MSTFDQGTHARDDLLSWYRSLYDHAPHPGLITDVAGIVTGFNQAAQRVLDLRPDRLVGAELALLVDERDRPMFRRWLDHGVPAASTTRRLRLATRGGVAVTASVVSGRSPSGEDELRWTMLTRDPTTTDGDGLSRAIREIVRAFASDDVDELLTTVCEVGATAVGYTAGGALLASRDGSLAIAAASTDDARASSCSSSSTARVRASTRSRALRRSR